MSASQEKKKRREERADGADKKQIQKNRTAKIKKRNTIIKSVVAVVVVVLLIAAVLFNSTLFYSGVSALSIGGHKYTAVEFNFFYQNAFNSTYNNLYSTYGQYVNYMLDPSKPLDEQQYSEEQTWDDFFEQSALDSIQQNAMLCDAANAEGYTLTDSDKANIETTISNAKNAANERGYDSFKKYLVAVYGRGFTENDYKELVTAQNLAASYSQVLIDRYTETYTDEQLKEKYDSVSDEYDLISYCYYYVDGSADDEAGIDADTAKNNAYETAKNISAAKTEEVFANLVREYAPEDEKDYYEDADVLLRKNVAPSNMDSSYSEWLTSSERKYGDCTYIEATNGYHVLLFVERNHNDYDLVSFRHILVKAEEDADAQEITYDTINAAQKKAEELYEQWQEDPTKENFITMANENSDDTGSNTNGGLYENVPMGRMVTEIEDWIFDPERKPGDTTIVYVSNSNYTGSHIVYFEGTGEQYNLSIAKGLKQQDDYNNWVDERKAEYEIDKGFAFRFAK